METKKMVDVPSNLIRELHRFINIFNRCIITFNTDRYFPAVSTVGCIKQSLLLFSSCMYGFSNEIFNSTPCVILFFHFRGSILSPLLCFVHCVSLTRVQKIRLFNEIERSEPGNHRETFPHSRSWADFRLLHIEEPLDITNLTGEESFNFGPPLLIIKRKYNAKR